MSDIFFEIKKRDTGSKARLAVLKTAHGLVNTPAFLPIGTKGSVKSVTAQELKFWGAEMVLANTYHLWMRPGDALIRNHGGLHKFMGWDGPIFTDSGGFQVFSLGEKRKFAKSVDQTDGSANQHGRVLEVSARGVRFQSSIDGQVHLLTPESSVQIQSNLGSDIALVLDFFPGYPFEESSMGRAVDLTLDWAERSSRQYGKIKADGINPDQKLFGIVQGGNYPKLRESCGLGLEKMDFAGYAIGGVAVGEPPEVMYEAVAQSIPYLRDEKPRHLLGVGTPEQILGAVARGCDTFDCVLPTRNARHGSLYINLKPQMGSGYSVLRIANEQYREDMGPVDNTCDCYLCRNHTRAYLRHLFVSREPLAIRLATMHNLKFYLNLMLKIRRAIEYGSLAELVTSYREY